MTEEIWLELQKVTEALEERNEQLRLQNAIFAAMVMNQERQHREKYELQFGKERKGYSWRQFATDVESALHTFENDLEELDK